MSPTLSWLLEQQLVLKDMSHNLKQIYFKIHILTLFIIRCSPESANQWALEFAKMPRVEKKKLAVLFVLKALLHITLD